MTTGEAWVGAISRTTNGACFISVGRPDAIPRNWPKAIALQFASGGTTVAFTIPAGATTAMLPASGRIQQGTVAGRLTVSLTNLESGSIDVLPASPPNRSSSIPSTAPVISANSVRITNVTPSGFIVELTGYSTSREVTRGTFSFTLGSAAQNPIDVTVDLMDTMRRWYASDEGLANGGAFLLQTPFTMNADTASLQSVSVRLTNSVGTSASVTGSRQ